MAKIKNVGTRLLRIAISSNSKDCEIIFPIIPMYVWNNWVRISDGLGTRNWIFVYPEPDKKWAFSKLNKDFSSFFAKFLAFDDFSKSNLDFEP